MAKGKTKANGKKKEGEVKFQTSVSWAGDDVRDKDGKIVERGFSLAPGDSCYLPEEIAVKREEAGLGHIVEDDEE